MNSSKSDDSLVRNIIALWRYLGRNRRTQFALLLALTLIAMFAEVLSIGAVIPFLTALTTPEALLEVSGLQPLWGYLGIDRAEDLLLPITLGFVAAAVFAALVRIALLWVNARLTVAMGVQLRSDLYTRVLYQPYEYHVARNSSELISMATEKVGPATNSGISHVLMLVTSLLLSIAIILTLLWVSPVVALSAFVMLASVYLLAGYLVKKRIKRNSLVIAEQQPQAVKCLQEGIGGIRDVIMDGSQGVFRDLYARKVFRILYAFSQNAFLGNLPKPLSELMGIVVITLLAYWLQTRSGSSNVLPVLGAMALGAQRLLPSLQQLYFSWSTINGNQAVLNEVVQQLAAPMPQIEQSTVKEALPLKQGIRLEDLSFSYAGHPRQVLDGISLNISRGSRVGFVGETGGGKSTLLDIIMGLLKPTSGKLLVDGEEITDKNLKQWQTIIAHVPQAIYLSDASLAENVAFGIPLEGIDHERVRLAARQAQIADYIESLPQGYGTPVGERGVRLSGGQRQRIGIARALYKQAKVIVFDEATSALDGKTEAGVMTAIDGLSEELTVIMIAHRISTLRKCDMIYRVSAGRITELGDFDSAFNQALLEGNGTGGT